MADVWVLQNSDKSLVGVYGSKKATNGKSSDEDARAIPFDIIEPKPTQTVEVPIQVEVPVRVEVPVYVPSDNADGAPLLAALNEITRVLTKANAPQPILAAITSISQPAIDAYNGSATEAPAEPVFDVSEPVVEQPASNEVDGDEAMSFLFGEEPDVEVSVEEPAPVRETVQQTSPLVVTDFEGDPEQDFLAPDEPVFVPPQQGFEFVAPPIEVPAPNFVPEPDVVEDDSDYDQAPPPVSSFLRGGETGLGDIVSPLGDPQDNPALTNNVTGLSSWLVAGPPETPAAPAAQTRRESLAQEAAQSTGETPQSVVI